MSPDTPINLHEWMHRTGMVPKTLSETLKISRYEISAIISGEVEMEPLMHYALIGLEHTLGGAPRKSPILSQPRGTLPDEFSKNAWAETTARIGFPALIKVAQDPRRETITYKEFHQLVVARGGKEDVGTMQKYAFVLGKIATAMTYIERNGFQSKVPVPPLTALVVNAISRMPSEGINWFVVEYLKRTDRADLAERIEDPKKRLDIFTLVWADIFKFKRWDEVMLYVGVTGDIDYDA